jgi:hypothetical protein
MRGHPRCQRVSEEAGLSSTWEVLGDGGVEDLVADSADEGGAAGDGALLLACDEHDDALVAALLDRRVPLLQHLVRVLERVGFALQRRQ